MLSRRTKILSSFLLILFPLLLGLFVYLCFNPESYVSQWVYRLANAEFPVNHANNGVVTIISSFAADFLWAFAFTVSIDFILNSTGFPWTALSITVLTGILLEICQKLQIFHGTADCFDILAELSAGILAGIILYFLKKKVASK